MFTLIRTIRKNVIFFTVFIIISSGASYVSYAKNADEPERPANSHYNLKYGPHKANRLDIIFPDDPKNIKEPVNAVLILHWGGWQDGDKENDAYTAAAFSRDAHMVAAAANYRLLGDGADAEDMLKDINLALNYIKDFSAAQNVSINKIFLMGNSAGAHLALLYAYKYRDNSPIPIAFVAGLSSPTDFTDPAFYEPDFPSQYAILPSLFKLTGFTSVNASTWPAYINKLRAISPVSYAYSGVPTVLAHGAKDAVIPVSNAERLKNVLTRAGIRVDLYIYPNSGHELENAKDAEISQGFYSKLFEYIYKYM